MGQEPIIANMNPASSGKPNTRASGYHQKALAEIRNSLRPFENGGTSSNDNYSSAASTISTVSTTSGVSSASGLSSNSNGLESNLHGWHLQTVSQIINMGYTEVSASYNRLKRENMFNFECKLWTRLTVDKLKYECVFSCEFGACSSTILFHRFSQQWFLNALKPFVEDDVIIRMNSFDIAASARVSYL